MDFFQFFRMWKVFFVALLAFWFKSKKRKKGIKAKQLFLASSWFLEGKHEISISPEKMKWLKKNLSWYSFRWSSIRVWIFHYEKVFHIFSCIWESDSPSKSSKKKKKNQRSTVRNQCSTGEKVWAVKSLTHDNNWASLRKVFNLSILDVFFLFTINFSIWCSLYRNHLIPAKKICQLGFVFFPAVKSASKNNPIDEELHTPKICMHQKTRRLNWVLCSILFGR